MSKTLEGFDNNLMNQILLKARAKINLTLDVLGKREDGYHNIEMIMQTINLYDTLFIKKIKKDTIKLITNIRWLPCDERNLAYKAAFLLKERYNIASGIFIELRKRIPVSAGLAGGSTNAAAVLIGLRVLFNLRITDEELLLIGRELGADVPYCIMRKTALAENIGDKLTPLPQCPMCYVVLAKPPISISTPYIYSKIDGEVLQKRPDTKKVIEAIEARDIETIAKNMYNVMESVTAKENPIINDLKDYFMKEGALGSVMSGSGPTVFAIFKDRQLAQNAYYKLKVAGEIRDVFLTTMYDAEN